MKGQKKEEKYRRHDVAFKLDAVKLANHPGIKTQDVATVLSIHPFMLSRWKKEYREGRLRMAKPVKVAASDLSEAERRIRALERENAQLREENDLLKKLEPSGSPRKRKSSPLSKRTEGGSK